MRKYLPFGVVIGPVAESGEAAHIWLVWLPSRCQDPAGGAVARLPWMLTAAA